MYVTGELTLKELSEMQILKLVSYYCVAGPGAELICIGTMYV